MNSAANIDGAKFLIDEVFPLIAEELAIQDAHLVIAGKNPYPDLVTAAEKFAPRITIKADVESMSSEIARASLVLLPLRIASGTRTRILEAALQQRPVVTTPIGVEGLELENGVLVGETALDLAAHVIHLMRNAEKRQELGAQLWQSAKWRYSGVTVGEQLLRAVRDAKAEQEVRSERWVSASK